MKPTKTDVLGSIKSQLPVLINGRKMTHSLWTRTAEDGRSATVSYDLDGTYRQLAGAVAVNHTARRIWPRVPVTFKLVGDGRVIWKSKPLRHPGETQSFDVRVDRYWELAIVADTGEQSNFHAVWIDPKLSGRGTPPTTRRPSRSTTNTQASSGRLTKGSGYGKARSGNRLPSLLENESGSTGSGQTASSANGSSGGGSSGTSPSKPSDGNSDKPSHGKLTKGSGYGKVPTGTRLPSLIEKENPSGPGTVQRPSPSVSEKTPTPPPKTKKKPSPRVK